MKTTKKIVALVLAVLMAATIFAGCSTAPENPDGSGDQGDPIKVNVLMVSGAQATGAQSVVADFEKWYKEKTGQEVKVTVTDLAYDSLLDKLTTESLGKSGSFDVLQLDHPWIGTFVENGLLEPIDSYVSNKELVDPEFDLDDFIGPVLEQYGKYNDKLYALPYLADVMLLYYRKDLFEKNKLELPQTWDEYLEVAKKLTQDTDGDGKIDIYGDALMGKKSHQNIMMWMQRYLPMVGKTTLEGTLFNADGTSMVNNPTAVKALQIFIDMLQYAPPSAVQDEFAETIAELQHGQAAMAEQWTMVYGQVNDPEQSEVAGKVEATLVPGVKQEDGSILRAPHLGGWSVAVSSYSKQKEAAFKFIEYLTFFKDKELAAIDVTPCRQSTYKDAELLKKFPHYPVILESLKIAVTRPTTPDTTQICEAANEEISAALAGSITAEQAMKNLDEKWNKIRKK